MPGPSIPNKVITSNPVVAAGDLAHETPIATAPAVGPTGLASQLLTDASSYLKVNVAAGGAAVTVADGADVTQGALADAAVVTDVNGTISGKMRGLVKILAAVTDTVSGWMKVSVQNATLAVTQSGNWFIGGIGRTILPSSVTSGSYVSMLLDRFGRTFVLSPVCSNASSAGTAITTNTNTTIVAAPAAGNHLRIHRVWAQNSSATGTWCYFGNGSGVKTIPFYLGQYQPFGMDLKGGWELSTATGLFLNTATTGANIEWFVEYETLAD